jgi:hypothetical protein
VWAWQFSFSGWSLRIEQNDEEQQIKKISGENLIFVQFMKGMLF